MFVPCNWKSSSTQIMTHARFDRNILTVLNDDCIYKILEWLSLDDLCSCSATCKRLQIVSNNHFRRKYPNESTMTVNIEINAGGILSASPLGKCARHFHNFVKDLTVCVRYDWLIFEQELLLPFVVNLVKTKCDRNFLRRICFDGYMDLVPIGKKIEKFLRNVEVVAFNGKKYNSQDEAYFLNYCPKVRKISLEGFYYGKENVEAILQQKCEQLTYFHYTDFNAPCLDAEKWIFFFQINKNIKGLALKFRDWNDEGVPNDNSIRIIQTLIHAQNLEYLIISLEYKQKNIAFDTSCVQYLNAMGNRNQFKRLELRLEFWVQNLNAVNVLNSFARELSNLKQLTKIHLSYVNLFQVIPALRLLINLKSVSFSNLLGYPNWVCSWSKLNVAADSAKNMSLPQIEEVHIDEIKGSWNLLTYVAMVVRHWVNVKRICVLKSHSNDTEFSINGSPLDELNRIRQKLSGACELTIFTDHRQYLHSQHSTIWYHHLVKLNLVRFARAN